MVNPPSCKILHKKASLAVLTRRAQRRAVRRRRAAGDRGVDSVDARRRGSPVDVRRCRHRSPRIHRRESRATRAQAQRRIRRQGHRPRLEGRQRDVEDDDRHGARRAVRRAATHHAADASRIRAWSTDAWCSPIECWTRSPTWRTVITGRLSDANLDRGVAQRHRRRRSQPPTFIAERAAGPTMKAPSLTIGIEEEYQIIDPETRELKSYITEILDGRSHDPRAGQARAAPVDGRGRHQGLPHAGRGSGPSWCGCAELVMDLAGEQWPRDRRGRHASVLVVDDAGDHAARALPRRASRTCRISRSSC